MPRRVMGSAAGELHDVLWAATPTHRRLRDQFVTIITATVGVDLLCAVAALLLERHSMQTQVKTSDSAAFWTHDPPVVDAAKRSTTSADRRRSEDHRRTG